MAVYFSSIKQVMHFDFAEKVIKYYSVEQE